MDTNKLSIAISYVHAAANSSNPLDNFDAWVRYNKHRGSPIDMTLPAFVAAWAQHHAFWFSEGTPCVVYRYEDMVARPMTVLQHVLHHSGLWARRSLRESDLLRAASVKRLQSFRSKQLGAVGLAPDDVFNSHKKVWCMLLA
jgi:hypothetical protein